MKGNQDGEGKGGWEGGRGGLPLDEMKVGAKLLLSDPTVPMPAVMQRAAFCFVQCCGSCYMSEVPMISVPSHCDAGGVRRARAW